MASIRKNIIDGKICLVTDQPFFFKYMIFDQLSFQAGKGIRGRWANVKALGRGTSSIYVILRGASSRKKGVAKVAKSRLDWDKNLPLLKTDWITALWKPGFQLSALKE